MRSACDRFPDRPALIFTDGLSVSRRELLHRTEALAAFLAGRISPGERVAVMISNRAEFMVAFFAISAVRAVLVSLSPTARHHDAGYILRDSGSVLVITEDANEELIQELRAECPGIREIVSLRDPEPRGFDRYVAKHSSSVLARAACAPSDITQIYYTSGTTGPPKGCMLDHTWWRRVLDVGLRLNPKTADDRLLCCLPFYYADPALFLLTVLQSDATLVVMRKFSVSRFWPAVREFGVTTFSSIGGMSTMLLKGEPSAADRDHNVKYVIATGVSLAAHRELVDRFGFPWLENYGSTEGGIGARMPLEFADEMIGSGSMGIPTPETALRIADENDQDVPIGRNGQILIKSPGMFRGYLNRPEQTAEAMRDGWYHTGDIGRRDERGFYYFVRRIKDIIRRSGENVSAAEVEEVLRAHPQIRDAAVIAEPDDVRGEEVKAFVLLVPGESERTVPPEAIVDWCTSQLASFKVPRYLVYREHDFPRTPSLRIRKDDLRREAITAWDREDQSVAGRA
jgi:acyl-CoA synthetase (AMP-forming)/AMP-acid ligase II